MARRGRLAQRRRRRELAGHAADKRDDGRLGGQRSRRRQDDGLDRRSAAFTNEFAQIWSLGYAHGTLYAGTKPASLLVSENGGKDWKRVQG